MEKSLQIILDDNVGPVRRYSSLLPDRICKSLNGIRNKKQRAILILLDIEGKKSFSQIQAIFNFKTNDLSYQLNSLETVGLINNVLKKEREYKDYSWYSLTNYGKDLISSIIDVYVKSLDSNKSIFKHF